MTDVEVSKVCPVNLRLLTHECHQPQVRLCMRSGAMVADEMPEMVWASNIAALFNHVVKTACGQCRECRQCLPDEGKVLINTGGASRTDARQPGLTQDSLNTPVMDAQLARNRAVAPFLDVVIAKYLRFNVRW